MKHYSIALLCATALTVSAGTYALEDKILQSVNSDLQSYLASTGSMEAALQAAIENNPNMAGYYLHAAYVALQADSENDADIDYATLIDAAVAGALASGQPDALADIAAASVNLATLISDDSDTQAQAAADLAEQVGASTARQGDAEDVAQVSAAVASTTLALGLSETQTAATLQAMVAGIQSTGDSSDLASALVALQPLVPAETVVAIAQANDVDDSVLAVLDTEGPETAAGGDSSAPSDEDTASGVSVSRPGNIGIGSGSGSGELTASPN